MLIAHYLVHEMLLNKIKYLFLDLFVFLIDEDYQLRDFFQMDGLLVRSTNPFDFTIKVGMYVCIYYDKLLGFSEDESLHNALWVCI